MARNLAGFGLSPGILRQHRIQVEQLCRLALEELTGDLAGEYLSLAEMSAEKRQQLVDEHLLFTSGDPNLVIAGMERDWPEGRGFFANQSNTFIVWVNEEDHLRIISMETGELFRFCLVFFLLHS